MLSQRVDVWINRGVEQGKLEGKLEGRLEGELDVILRQLTRKFGSLSSRQVSQLKALSAQELLGVSERILEINSFDELFDSKSH